jgi:hypothetical protein
MVILTAEYDLDLFAWQENVGKESYIFFSFFAVYLSRKQEY